MGFELKEKIYPLKDGETVDDVCEKIVSLTALPFAIETITITKTAIRAMLWVQSDVTPPYGELPYEDPSSISSLLGSIDLLEIEPNDEVELNLKSLSVVASMLIRARSTELAGIAWLVGDPAIFCKWIGITNVPVRFLELPLIPYSEFHRDKLLLLCGKSAQHHPFQAKLGVTTYMVVKEDQDA